MNSNHAEDKMEGAVGEQRRKMPMNRKGITHKVNVQGQEGYVIANVQEDGSLGEIFLHGFGKSGSTLDGWVQVCAILFSTAIQYGAELPMLIRKISHTKFEPFGETDNPEIPHCRSVPDYIMKYLALRFGDAALLNDLAKIDQELENI
jgi:ribonucleoside-diphosphate reductase alpha chain